MNDLLFLVFVFNWSRGAGHIVWGSCTSEAKITNITQKFILRYILEIYPRDTWDITGNRVDACYFTLRLNPKFGDPNKISIIRRQTYLVTCERDGLTDSLVTLFSYWYCTTCSSLALLLFFSYKWYSDHVSTLMYTKWYLIERIIYQWYESVNAR